MKVGFEIQKQLEGQYRFSQFEKASETDSMVYVMTKNVSNTTLKDLMDSKLFFEEDSQISDIGSQMAQASL